MEGRRLDKTTVLVIHPPKGVIFEISYHDHLLRFKEGEIIYLKSEDYDNINDNIRGAYVVSKPLHEHNNLTFHKGIDTICRVYDLFPFKRD